MSESTGVRIVELPRATVSGYVVFLTAEGSPPSAADLADCLGPWLADHASERLRDAVGGTVDSDLVTRRLVERDHLPSAPLELLRRTGLTPLEEQALEAASHGVLVSASDDVRGPRFGLFSALAAALAIGAAFDGVVLDFVTLRILGREWQESAFDEIRLLAVTSHVAVSFAPQARGWMATRGMTRLGLPELEVFGVPADLPEFATVINSAAQVLFESVMQQAERRQMELPLTMTVTSAHQARAHATLPGVDIRTIEVGLTYPGPHSTEARPVVELHSPLQPEVGTGTDTAPNADWHRATLAALLGEPTRRVRLVAPRSDAMIAAHERAMSELPAIRERLAAGLSPGETLLLKKAFDCSDGSLEFMWLAVLQWDGERIVGSLTSLPQRRPDLQPGSIVPMSEGEIEDWVIAMPDGSHLGGYTTEVAVAEGALLS